MGLLTIWENYQLINCISSGKFVNWNMVTILLGQVPSYNPIFIKNDTIIIFDNVKQNIIFIDSTFLLLKTPFRFDMYQIILIKYI